MAEMKKNERAQINIEGIDCATCAAKIEKGLNNLGGINHVDVSIGAEKATIDFDPSVQSLNGIISRLETLGYKAEEAGLTGTSSEVKGLTSIESEQAKHRRNDYLRIAWVVLMTALSLSGLFSKLLPFDVALLGIAVGALPIVGEGYSSLKARNITVETFMSLAIIATVIIGEYVAASVIVIFLLLAEIIENYTVDKARQSIKELIKITPVSARVVRGRDEVIVDPSEIEVGDKIVVKAGEKVPVDGLIVYGGGSIDQSTITGESLPVDKSEGDHVFAGTINMVGLLIVETHRKGSETTLAKIIELVEEAESAKAPVQRLADRFVAYFTPVVLGIAILTFLISGSLIFAISVIVVACPCSIAIATPLAVVASSGKAARQGIIIKGGKYLESLARIDILVMDKTGTLTLGEPRVTDIEGFDGHDEREILEYAAITEKFSEHSLGRAIIEKGKELGIVAPDPDSFEVIPGKGVLALTSGRRIMLGNRDLMIENGISIGGRVENYLNMREREAKTAMLIAHDGEVCGAISVTDVVREQTRGALRSLREDLKISRLVMLTGDNFSIAERVAHETGIDEFYADLLPEEKVEKIKELKATGAKVAMVGDGINDAPALAEADIGIAMGAAGTDVAVEAADVALMHDDWFHLVEAILIGRRTFNTIKQNLWISMVFNVVGVSLASIGILTPIMAAAAHILPDVGVFLNSSRIMVRSKRADN